jgi:hypothetical protein
MKAPQKRYSRLLDCWFFKFSSLSGCQQAGRRLYIFGSSKNVQQAGSLLLPQAFKLSGRQQAAMLYINDSFSHK